MLTDSGPERRRPTVLVLLAAYNGAPWIAEQVDSILRQVDVEVSLVVSDDGSTDDTRGALNRAHCGDRIRVIETAAPTGSAAQNFFSLIRSETGAGADFVAFADQDDVWETDKLNRACSILAERGAAGYSSSVIACWPDGTERILHQARKQTRSDFLFEGAGQGCTFVLSADLYERARRFILLHPHLAVDLHYHDWSIYALARTWKLPWVFDRRPSLRYRQHGANDTGARMSLAGIARRFSLIRSGWYRKQIAAIAELCHAAAPGDPTIREWRSLLRQADGARRRSGIVRFCVRGGRRRLTDRAMLVVAALLGWL